jgi:hypothetical protein
MIMPRPTITRKLQNTHPTGGRSLAGHSFSPRIFPSNEPVTIRLPTFGIDSA